MNATSAPFGGATVSTDASSQRHNVGGVLLPRPFKIRRLGHFGFSCVNIDEAFHFYADLLGFRVSDVRDEAKRLTPEQAATLTNTNGYFMRHGGDHHSFVLYNKAARDMLDGTRKMRDGVTINQITWQVGSLQEVVAGHHWLVDQGQTMRRSGRDMPGSNWHTYLFDPDGHVNELYYGIEQIGWSGHAKPAEMHAREFKQAPPLPQICEQEEVENAIRHGVDLQSGYRYVDPNPAEFDVDGILLPRPFKIVRHGPVSLFVEDLDEAERFYRDTLGFIPTDEVLWRGHRCLFMRNNTEHHSLALYPIALRSALGFSEHTTSMAFGLQVANYRQLRDAVAFLTDRRVERIDVPPELTPGFDYVAHVRDPDGHVLQLYYYMEQIGWDGRPRPPELRPPAARFEHWPEQVETPAPDVYLGEAFLGPWG
jgi:catechol 2,3-dioxygenase-like lactoylglutathione lyase family enzyme